MLGFDTPLLQRQRHTQSTVFGTGLAAGLALAALLSLALVHNGPPASGMAPALSGLTVSGGPTILQSKAQPGSKGSASKDVEDDSLPRPTVPEPRPGPKNNGDYGVDDNFRLPKPAARCEFVIDQIMAHNANHSHAMLTAKFKVQSQDVNAFFRGVSYLFWHDFVRNGWGDFDVLSMLPAHHIRELEPMHISRTSFWTWITGDQHVSNFGAWRNRHGAIVYGINDFDESVVYDFQIDIWRLAVSMYDHALTNGLTEQEGVELIYDFCHTYVDTMARYVGKEDAQLFEVTDTNTGGQVGNFLRHVAGKNEGHQMLHKFTYVKGQQRRFIFSEATQLRPVSASVRAAMEAQFTATAYGATLGKVGWNEKGWDDSVFRILDVGQRTGSGDGSYGLPRYYVLIAGSVRETEQGDGVPEPTRPGLPTTGVQSTATAPSPPSESPEAGLNAVILDIKMMVPPAMKAELGERDEAWYSFLFRNEAARAIEAQRRFTSYTDPWLGWLSLFGNSYAVRERSPWKASFPVESLVSRERFADFAETLAIITATSHARGSFGRAPAQIKEVITATIGGYDEKQAWSRRISATAIAYRKQVEFDYDCFKAWVDSRWLLNGSSAGTKAASLDWSYDGGGEDGDFWQEVLGDTGSR